MTAAERVRDEYQTFLNELDEHSITGDISTSMRGVVDRLNEAIATDESAYGRLEKLCEYWDFLSKGETMTTKMIREAMYEEIRCKVV